MTEVGRCGSCGVIGPIVVLVTVGDWIYQCCPPCARRQVDPLGGS